MEDDNIRNLFQSFEPALSSDSKFMERLQQSIDAVEIVKQHTAVVRKRHKLAVLIAAVSGFVMGVVMTLLYPIISGWMANMNLSFQISKATAIDIDSSFIGIIVMSAVCVIVTLNIYELALVKLTAKKPVDLVFHNVT